MRMRMRMRLRQSHKCSGDLQTNRIPNLPPTAPATEAPVQRCLLGRTGFPTCHRPRPTVNSPTLFHDHKPPTRKKQGDQISIGSPNAIQTFTSSKHYLIRLPVSSWRNSASVTLFSGLYKAGAAAYIAAHTTRSRFQVISLGACAWDSAPGPKPTQGMP